VSGTVISTENTYKYHIQVQENNSSPVQSTTTHTRSGPLKQLLKPATTRNATSESHNHTHAASEEHIDSDHNDTATVTAAIDDGSVLVVSLFVCLSLCVCDESK